MNRNHPDKQNVWTGDADTIGNRTIPDYPVKGTSVWDGTENVIPTHSGILDHVGPMENTWTDTQDVSTTYLGIMHYSEVPMVEWESPQVSERAVDTTWHQSENIWRRARYDSSSESEHETPVKNHSPDAFRFGIELEMLFTFDLARLETNLWTAAKYANAIKPLSWDAAQDILVHALTRQLKFHNLDAKCTKMDTRDYTTWVITRDSSIPQMEGESTYGFEIISPVLVSEELWINHLTCIFDLLASLGQITFSSRCGTHVHISPARNEWTLNAAANLSKCVVALDDLIDYALPPHRLQNLYWCSGNMSSGRLAEDAKTSKKDHQKPFLIPFRVIDEFTEIKPLVEYLSPGKLVSWNFRPLLDRKGTIEFRKPPMVLGVSNAEIWITFTLLFSAASKKMSRNPSCAHL